MDNSYASEASDSDYYNLDESIEEDKQNISAVNQNIQTRTTALTLQDKDSTPGSSKFYLEVKGSCSEKITGDSHKSLQGKKLFTNFTKSFLTRNNLNEKEILEKKEHELQECQISQEQDKQKSSFKYEDHKEIGQIISGTKQNFLHNERSSSLDKTENIEGESEISQTSRDTIIDELVKDNEESMFLKEMLIETNKHFLKDKKNNEDKLLNSAVKVIFNIIHYKITILNLYSFLSIKSCQKKPVSSLQYLLKCFKIYSEKKHSLLRMNFRRMKKHCELEKMNEKICLGEKFKNIIQELEIQNEILNLNETKEMIQVIYNQIQKKKAKDEYDLLQKKNNDNSEEFTKNCLLPRIGLQELSNVKPEIAQKPQPPQIPAALTQPRQVSSVPYIPKQPPQVPSIPTKTLQVPSIPTQPPQVPSIPTQPPQVPSIPTQPPQIPSIPTQPPQVPSIPTQPPHAPSIPQVPQPPIIIGRPPPGIPLCPVVPSIPGVIVPQIVQTKPQQKPPKDTNPKKLLWTIIPKNRINSTFWINEKYEPEVDYEKLILHFCEPKKKEINQNEKTQKNEQKEKPQESTIKILDDKKIMNLEISLSKIKMQNEEIQKIIEQFDIENNFDVEIIDKIISLVPNKEETEKLNLFTGDLKLLSRGERFCKMICSVKYFQKKLEFIKFQKILTNEKEQIVSQIKILKEALTSIKNSTLFLHLMKLILGIGNFLNSDTSRGNAQGVYINTLSLLETVKSFGKDKQTLLEFLVQNIKGKEPSLFHFSKGFSRLEESLKIDQAELEGKIKEFASLTKMILTEKETISKECDSNSYMNFLCNLEQQANENLKEILCEKEFLQQALESTIIFFGEDPKLFKLCDFLKLISDFVVNFKKSQQKLSDDEVKALKLQSKQDQRIRSKYSKELELIRETVTKNILRKTAIKKNISQVNDKKCTQIKETGFEKDNLLNVEKKKIYTKTREEIEELTEGTGTDLLKINTPLKIQKLNALSENHRRLFLRSSVKEP